MERWTFLVLADDDGTPKQIRMFLRAGNDESAWPSLQVGMDGVEVPVDETPKDYEAPEWKALELFTGGGGTPEGWEILKERLRDRAPTT
jgi:hypothetical protein